MKVYDEKGEHLGKWTKTVFIGFVNMENARGIDLSM